MQTQFKASPKVLHLVSGSLAGGAARGVVPLHHAMRACGVDSMLLVDHGEVFSDPSILSTELTATSKFGRQLRWHLDGLPLKIYNNRERTPFSVGLVGANLANIVRREQPDIINLHWVNAAFVNVRHLHELNVPIVWTMRDLWPLTGGCHYPLACEQYTTACGRCAQLGSSRTLDLSRLLSSRKAKIYRNLDITFVGISQWVSDCAARSSATGHSRIETILNCIDTSAFFPVEKAVARRALGLPSGRPLVLFGAHNPKDSYKGYDSLVAFLRLAESEGLECQVAAFGTPPTDLFQSTKLPHKAFGPLRDEISLRLAYSAADVFLAPSHQEAFGKTIAEALACGTPAVAYDIGGPREIIQHGKSGYLSRPFHPEDLLAGVRWVLANNTGPRITQACHERATSAFSPARAAREYLSLYRSILDRRARAICGS